MNGVRGQRREAVQERGMRLGSGMAEARRRRLVAEEPNWRLAARGGEAESKKCNAKVGRGWRGTGASLPLNSRTRVVAVIGIPKAALASSGSRGVGGKLRTTPCPGRERLQLV